MEEDFHSADEGQDYDEGEIAALHVESMSTDELLAIISEVEKPGARGSDFPGGQ